MERPRRHRAEQAAPIDAIIRGVLGKARHQHAALMDIQQAWPSIVGRELARHTQPVSVRRGRLTVHAEQPGDSFALSYQRAQALDRVRELTSGAVTELVIRPGAVKR
ncbi:MAG: DUF721 domain-containing protein [Candidatus Omnitrophica bacterium]|nr:DUF721 domain-containing protein [Candidatus Omnitrophota bacterium]